MKHQYSNSSSGNNVLATSGGEVKPTPPMSFQEVMTKAAQSAARGGAAGAIAMGANVACLMWMRTTVRGGGAVDDGLPFHCWSGHGRRWR